MRQVCMARFLYENIMDLTLPPPKKVVKYRVEAILLTTLLEAEMNGKKVSLVFSQVGVMCRG